MRFVLSVIFLFSLTACATASKFTIEDRLNELGLSRGQASCVADELDDRLNDRELRDFARFTDQITAPDRPSDLIRSLERISDEKIARAVAQSGVSCVFAR